MIAYGRRKCPSIWWGDNVSKASVRFGIKREMEREVIEEEDRLKELTEKVREAFEHLNANN